MKVLFINYYGVSLDIVGAKRIAYWYNNIEFHNIEKEIIYAVGAKSDNEEKILLQDTPKKGLLNRLIKDAGISWEKDIKRYFSKDSNRFTYDIVIISGGPFMHMRLSKFFKKKFNAKVFLDFRDPFANNPLFKNARIKIAIKRYFEKRFIKYADKCITVNEYCADLLKLPQEKKIIIQNGYDETVLENNKSFKFDGEKKNIVYTGKIYENFNTTEFVQAILKMENDICFNYYGSSSVIVNNKDGQIINHGMVNYDYIISVLKACDIAVIFTEGKEFQSTTKIFDYMACNCKILIVTDGDIKDGDIHNITRSYPNVYWVSNEINKIEKAIYQVLDNDVLDFDPTVYSRRVGLELLVNELKKCLN